ncbi:MAG: hypothetical protein ACRDGM_20430, partial [bacterium]
MRRHPPHGTRSGPCTPLVDAALYRPRWPAETSLYALLEALYESVKGSWEDLFERRYGFWRGILDGVVAR